MKNFPLSIRRNISLKPFNTFGVESTASAFSKFSTGNELAALLEDPHQDIFILGGGSNILLVDDIEMLVLKNEIGGIRVLENIGSEWLIEVGAGVDWHSFVTWAVDQGLGGVENLALIPGTVGAAPIQNIGAYGVELKDVFHSLDAMRMDTGETVSMTMEQCAFGYRDSIFKGSDKGRFCITGVRLVLQKSSPQLNLEYGAIREILYENRIISPGIRDIYDAVIRIRSSKLPDPAKLGNSGSFFKNPEIDADQFEGLRSAFPDLIFYKIDEKTYKIPAGWMIEKCGWKGKRIGDAGCYPKQALVLVNYGKATGRDIYNLAMQIQESVFNTFGISLTPEVNILGKV